MAIAPALHDRGGNAPLATAAAVALAVAVTGAFVSLLAVAVVSGCPFSGLLVPSSEVSRVDPPRCSWCRIVTRHRRAPTCRRLAPVARAVAGRARHGSRCARVVAAGSSTGLEGHGGHRVRVAGGGGRPRLGFTRQGEEEVLQALDLETGRVVWKQAYPAPYTMNPAASSHGKGPKSTPVVAEGRICTLGITGGRVLRRREGHARLAQVVRGRIQGDRTDFRRRDVAGDRPCVSSSLT